MDQGAKQSNPSKCEEMSIHSNNNKPDRGKKEKGFQAQATAHVFWIIVSSAIIVILFIVVIVLVTVWRVKQAEEPPSCQAGSITPLCPDGWIGYQEKCYYFSNEETDWFASLHNCSLLNASLSMIETDMEMDFLLRYKGSIYHWIGLSKDPEKHWKWANGKAFNNTFTIGKGGDCAYLSDKAIMSSWCKTKKNWICSKADSYMQRTKHESNVKKQLYVTPHTAG